MQVVFACSSVLVGLTQPSPFSIASCSQPLFSAPYRARYRNENRDWLRETTSSIPSMLCNGQERGLAVHRESTRLPSCLLRNI